MVLLEVGLERDGQRERCNAGVRCLADDRGAAQLLQREAKVAVQRQSEGRLKEHDTLRVLVVLKQTGDAGRGGNGRIVTIEAVRDGENVC